MADAILHGSEEYGQYNPRLVPQVPLSHGRLWGDGLPNGWQATIPMEFHLDLHPYINRFDETCQGTVPVALWIVLHSTSFEDALRQAVALGADSDTSGAITGSMAEALWGIPEWMKVRALLYLPEE